MNHPEQLGKYRIMGVLGSGAMGVVYRGFDPDIRRVVALKTIRRSAGDGAESAAQSAVRLRNEAQAAGRLVHPGIVGVYDFGDDGQIAYIAMEFVEGHALSAYLHQRVRFGAGDAACIVTQLLEALSHAHEHKVWHCDIKPSNVIMTRSGRVKIADFGIARTDDSGLTVPGGALGTPMYMAPEQFMGQTIDHRVDLYGVGIVLYQLVAGRQPFVGTPESLMYRAVHEVPQAPSTVETGTQDARFDAVVARALAKKPAERYARAEDFRHDLAAALGQPAPHAVAQNTVSTLLGADAYEATQRMEPLATASLPISAPATNGSIALWDRAVLAQLEALLARHVGPLAGTMVRRAARECADMASLQALLAEQITQVSVRDAFLAQLHRSGGGGSGSVGALAQAGPPTQGTRGAAPVSEAWTEQAQKLLAAHVGPIARVVLKRALDRTKLRAPLIVLLVEAAPDAARVCLQAELARLGTP